VTKLRTAIPILKTTSFLLHGAEDALFFFLSRKKKKRTPAAHALTMHAITEARTHGILWLYKRQRKTMTREEELKRKTGRTKKIENTDLESIQRETHTKHNKETETRRRKTRTTERTKRRERTQEQR